MYIAFRKKEKTMTTFIAYSPRLHRSHEIKADYYVEGNNSHGIPTFTFYRNDKKISQVETEYFKVREV